MSLPSSVWVTMQGLYLPSGAAAGTLVLQQGAKVTVPAAGVNITIGTVLQYSRSPAGKLTLYIAWALR